MNNYFKILFSLLLLSISQVCFSAEWKKLCVDGADTGGKNNSTWQKLNTTSNGGSTWKKIGDCIAPEPPIPPGPVEPAYTHILDTGPDFYPGGRCPHAGGLRLQMPAPYSWPQDPRFAGGTLTPPTMNGSRVFEMIDNCSQNFTISFENTPVPLFKTMTIIGVVTYTWNEIQGNGPYVCYEPNKTGEDLQGYACGASRTFRTTPHLQPYTRYYIKVTL